LTTEGPCVQSIMRWGADGQHEWTVSVIVSCSTNSGIVATSIAANPASSGSVVAGGWFSGTVDVGTGALASQNSDVIVLGLKLSDSG
jgi:hypothetical protein